MKQASQILLSVLGVSLVAGALLWKQQQEIQSLESRLQVADQELEQQQTEHAELEKKFAETRQQTSTLESALSAAQESAKPGKSAEAKRERGGGNGGNVSEEMLHQYLADANDPAVMRRLNTEARNQTLRRFADLLKQLNLPPDQNEALVKLLTDKRQVALDTAVASFQQGNDPTQDMDAYRDLMFANRDSIEAQINALLGPTNYAQYQDNLRSVGQNAVVNNLQLTLSGTSDPLTPDQAAQIQQVMQENSTSRINARVIAASKDILTPVQMQALQDLRAIQQANAIKRTQPVQVLPTSAPPAPPAPTGK
jgi:hypothetical protein